MRAASGGMAKPARTRRAEPLRCVVDRAQAVLCLLVTSVGGRRSGSLLAKELPLYLARQACG